MSSAEQAGSPESGGNVGGADWVQQEVGGQEATLVADTSLTGDDASQVPNNRLRHANV